METEIIVVWRGDTWRQFPTVPAPVVPDPPPSYAESLGKKPRYRQIAVVQLLKRRGPMTMAQIAEQQGIGPRATYTVLKVLIDQGVVRLVSRRRPAIYAAT